MKKILAAAVAMTMAGLSQGATVTGNLDVSATVATACVLTNFTNSLTFTTTFNPTGPAVTATGDIGVTCNNGLNYTIALGNGGNFLAGVRRMNDGGSGFLEYTISRPDNAVNATNTGTPWIGANVVSRTGNGSNQPATAYGQITAGGNNASATPGSYGDTVLITVTF